MPQGSGMARLWASYRRALRRRMLSSHLQLLPLGKVCGPVITRQPDRLCH